MPHAILLFCVKEKKKRETINETGESLRRNLGCVNTEIKHETGPGDSWRTDGGRIGEGNGGEVRGWREKQKHRLWTAPERRGSVSLHHLLTDNSTNSSQMGCCVRFPVCTGLQCALTLASAHRCVSVLVSEPDRHHLLLKDFQHLTGVNGLT